MNTYIKVFIWIAFASSIVFLYYRLSNQEDIAWKKACDNNTIAAYEKYIQKYQQQDDAMYLNTARHRIDSISIVNEYQKGIQSNDIQIVQNVIDSLAFRKEDSHFEQTFFENKICDLQTHLGNILKENELNLYQQAIRENTLEQYEQFLKYYPQSQYFREINSKYQQLKYEANARVAYENITTSSQCDVFLRKYGKSSFAADVMQKKLEFLREEERDKYKNNSLATGSTPWSNKYGSNSYCYSDYSNIVVYASNTEDAVITIKKGNSSGRVVRHAYIRAGDSYTFEVPNGTYTVFFYSGKGWNPKQSMPNGLKGGFVQNGNVTKSDPKYLNDVEWTITLYTTYNGNFSPEESNTYEMLN